jgi:hypothetical protein
MTDHAALGKKVLAGLDRGRQIAIAQQQAHAAELRRLVLEHARATGVLVGDVGDLIASGPRPLVPGI